MSNPAALSSMTGFARQVGGDEGFSWTWEAKSVNSRSRDLRCRLPHGYDRLEENVRTAVTAAITRGNLQVTLTLDAPRSRPAVRLNRELLSQVVTTLQELQAEQDFERPRPDGLLSIPGMLESVEEPPGEAEQEAREVALKAGLAETLKALVSARQAEGQRIGKAIEAFLAALAALVEQAGRTAATQPEAVKTRLIAQVQELCEAVPALPEERLAQEAVLLATKADVREELDRLAAHLEAARELMAAGGPVGRRLDFLCQELNREANTICSKAAELELTRIGLDLKSTIEQLREQVQNLE